MTDNELRDIVKSVFPGVKSWQWDEETERWSGSVGNVSVTLDAIIDAHANFYVWVDVGRARGACVHRIFIDTRKAVEPQLHIIRANVYADLELAHMSWRALVGIGV